MFFEPSRVRLRVRVMGAMGAMRQSTGTCRADYSAVSTQKGTCSNSLYQS